MKVVKPAHTHITCYRCNAVLEVTRDDVAPGSVNALGHVVSLPTVQCPECFALLEVSLPIMVRG